MPLIGNWSIFAFSRSHESNGIYYAESCINHLYIMNRWRHKNKNWNIKSHASTSLKKNQTSIRHKCIHKFWPLLHWYNYRTFANLNCTRFPQPLLLIVFPLLLIPGINCSISYSPHFWKGRKLYLCQTYVNLSRIPKGIHCCLDALTAEVLHAPVTQ